MMHSGGEGDIDTDSSVRLLLLRKDAIDAVGGIVPLLVVPVNRLFHQTVGVDESGTGSGSSWTCSNKVRHDEDCRRRCRSRGNDIRRDSVEVEDDTDDDDPTVLVDDARGPKNREGRTCRILGGPRTITGSSSPDRCCSCCWGWFHLGRHNRVEEVGPMNGTPGNRRFRFRSSAPPRRGDTGAVSSSSSAVVAILSLP